MEDKWRFVCVVRGYHIYKDMGDPYLDDGFTTKHERNNSHDKYTMAVLPVDAKSKRTVGHLPREIFKECCLVLFGANSCKIIRNARHHSPFYTYTPLHVHERSNYLDTA